jgi:hypothetical protein
VEIDSCFSSWRKQNNFMDHLPLPIDELAHAPLEVPFVCDNRFLYDEKDFVKYPSRRGIDIDALYLSDEVDWDQWAPFLQAWLWFGLLGQTLDLQSGRLLHPTIMILESFVTTKSNGSRVVTTQRLRQHILPLRGKFHASQYHRFCSCLTEVQVNIKRMISHPSWQIFLAEARRATDLPLAYKVLLSIQILFDTICASMNVPISSNVYLNDEQLSTELVDILLERAGWCSFQIRKLPVNIRVRYYLSHLSPFDVKEHSLCSRELCSAPALEEDKAHFEPTHTSAGCACNEVSISDEDIESIIGQGDVPVLSFSEAYGGQRQLKITYSRMKETTEERRSFVAISHVRHLGLGNHGKHSLPYCQLAWIQLIADEVLGTGTSSVYFWLDTMCLPLRYQSRAPALRHVRQVYQVASKVVVLDPYLYGHSVGSFEESIFRIRYSCWKTRLWTLQEGVIAKELHIRFKNRSWRLDKIVEGYEKCVNRLLQTKDFVVVDEVRLKTQLDRFDDDIKTIIRRGIDIDRTKLQKMLRLGYLAHNQYRYFCEDQETEDSRLVVKLLTQVYVNGSVDEQVARSLADQVLERLKHMEAFDIQ